MNPTAIMQMSSADRAELVRLLARLALDAALREDPENETTENPAAPIVVSVPETSVKNETPGWRAEGKSQHGGGGRE